MVLLHSRTSYTILTRIQVLSWKWMLFLSIQAPSYFSIEGRSCREVLSPTEVYIVCCKIELWWEDWTKLTLYCIYIFLILLLLLEANLFLSGYLPLNWSMNFKDLSSHSCSLIISSKRCCLWNDFFNLFLGVLESLFVWLYAKKSSTC